MLGRYKYLLWLMFILCAGLLYVVYTQMQGSRIDPKLALNGPMQDREIAGFNIQRVMLGDSGMSLRTPYPFLRTAETAQDYATQQKFRFERNGIMMEVQYISFHKEPDISLEALRREYDADLSRQAKSGDLHYSIQTVSRSGLDGLLVKAKLPIKYLDKHMGFDILTFINQRRLWRVTTRYKNCDKKGQALAAWMMESIEFSS